MDWFSRRVLAWRLSNTMDVEFCIEAVEEAMTRFGWPLIFNTDQGSQFTGLRVIPKGIENDSLVFRFNTFETGSEARAGIGKWVDYCNPFRPHSAPGGKTPMEAQMACDGIRMAA